MLGGRLPLSTAEKANVELYEYSKRNGYLLDISSHSRGGLTTSVALQNANNHNLAEIPIREARFFGTATHVESVNKQLQAKNGSYRYKDKDGQWQQGNSVVSSAVHEADFVGNKWNLGLTGFNDVTGGNCILCYSHSSYFAERPSKYLINEQGQYIDLKGNVVKEKVENPYHKEFKEKWGPKDEVTNPSLPKPLPIKQEIKR